MTEDQQFENYKPEEDEKTIMNFVALALTSHQNKRKNPSDWIKYATMFTKKRDLLRELADHPNADISYPAQMLLNIFEPDDNQE